MEEIIINNQVPLHLSYIWNTPYEGTIFPISLNFGRTRLWSVVIYLGWSRVFFPVWRLVRSNQDGERAEPLAKMLLSDKHAGRPQIVSRIIVKEYCAL